MIAKVKPFNADISVVAPPSKSFAHRLMIASALGSGKTLIKGVGSSDDVLATARCLMAIGAKVEINGGNAEVEGIAGKALPKTAVLDCGESGSTLRFLTPIVSALGITAKFIGKGNLFKRPNEILTSLLNSHGVFSNGRESRGKLFGGVYEVDASVSSQYISGLLFALPLLNEKSKILLKGEIVSADYINITLEVLERAGVRIEKNGGEIVVYPSEYKTEKELVCEGDWSGSAFLLSLGVTSGKAEVKGLNLNSRQGDERIIDIIKSAGGKIEEGENSVTAYKSELKGFEVNLENCPDLAPVVAVLSGKAKGESRIKGLKRLKIKESDRFSAICDFLKEAGVKFTATDGEITVFGNGELKGGNFDGYGDHRIVMAETVLSASAVGSSVVSGAESVKKSYPEFFKDICGGQNVLLEG